MARDKIMYLKTNVQGNQLLLIESDESPKKSGKGVLSGTVVYPLNKVPAFDATSSL